MILNRGCPVLDRAHHSRTQVTIFELGHYRGPTRDLTGSQGGLLSWRPPAQPNRSERVSAGSLGILGGPSLSYPGWVSTPCSSSMIATYANGRAFAGLERYVALRRCPPSASVCSRA